MGAFRYIYDARSVHLRHSQSHYASTVVMPRRFGAKSIYNVPFHPIFSTPSLLRSQLVGMYVKALSYEGFSRVAVGWRMKQHGSVGAGVRVQGWTSVGVSRLGQKGPRVICGQGRHSLKS